MRRRLIGLAAVALGIGVATLLYRGPGRALVRGHLGDVAATMLVYAVLGIAWRTRPWLRAITALAIASAIELGQTVWHATSFAGELIAGSTFDGRDFVAYVAGIAIALGWELALPAGQRSGEPAP